MLNLFKKKNYDKFTTRFKWAHKSAEKYSEIFNCDSISSDYFRPVYAICNSWLKNKRIVIELISSYRQSSFIAHRGNESAIFFDVGQSFIFKNIFANIAKGEDYGIVAEILKKSGCLNILKEGPTFSALIRPLQINQDDENYLADKGQLLEYKKGLYPYFEVFRSPFFSEFIDLFITGHEMYHYMDHRGLLDKSMSRHSQDFFEFALNTCCYENSPNFKRIATADGRTPLTTDALEKIRIDLINRREYYTIHRTELMEEIECDMFSFHIIMDYLKSESGNDAGRLFEFSYLFYILFNFFDLHFAINARFVHSMKNGIETVKPPDIADMHLRKVALIEIMRNYIYYSSMHDILDTQTIDALLDNYSDKISGFKFAIDNLYIIPIIRSIKNSLLAAEQLQGAMNATGVIFSFDEKGLLKQIVDEQSPFEFPSVDRAFIPGTTRFVFEA